MEPSWKQGIARLLGNSGIIKFSLANKGSFLIQDSVSSGSEECGLWPKLERNLIRDMEELAPLNENCQG